MDRLESNMSEERATRPYYYPGELAALSEPELRAELGRVQSDLDKYLLAEGIDPDPARRLREHIYDRKLGRMELKVWSLEQELRRL